MILRASGERDGESVPGARQGERRQNRETLSCFITQPPAAHRDHSHTHSHTHSASDALLLSAPLSFGSRGSRAIVNRNKRQSLPTARHEAVIQAIDRSQARRSRDEGTEAGARTLRFGQAQSCDHCNRAADQRHPLQQPAAYSRSWNGFIPCPTCDSCLDRLRDSLSLSL